MSRQLSRDPHVALAGLQAVYGADVVQASAGHIVPRRSVGTRHHPGRAQRDGMHLRDTMSREVKKTQSEERMEQVGEGLWGKSPFLSSLSHHVRIDSKNLCCFGLHR